MSTDPFTDPDVQQWIRARLRQAGTLRFGPERDAGVSANAMVEQALGGPAPQLDQFPRDGDDLAACERCYADAPLALRAAMAVTLERYRTHLRDGAPVTQQRGMPLSEFAGMLEQTEDETVRPG